MRCATNPTLSCSKLSVIVCACVLQSLVNKAKISELGIRGNALTQIQIQFDMSETCVTPYMYLKSPSGSYHNKLDWSGCSN